MSKPAFEDMFNLKSGRRNRKSFALFMLAQLGISISLFSVIFVVTPALSEFEKGLIALLVFVVGVGLLMTQFCAMAQRCRDIGYRGFWVILNFIPVVALIFQALLLIVPGTKGPNQYGPDPLDPEARAEGLTSANTNASILSK